MDPGSLPESIVPATVGGRGLGTDDIVPTHATGPNMELSSVRIIALLGASDWCDRAAPQKEDGWLVSDFYLLNYLLEDSANIQNWFTCIDPRTWVAKYGQLAHGDPKSDDRKVVLDKFRLEKVQNIKVCKPDELKKDFAVTLKSESEEAASRGEHLLVILLGHGVFPSDSPDLEHNIIVGGGGDPDDATVENRLSIAEFGRLVKEDAKITLLSNSCFSGNWTIAPGINLTILAGANADRETFSWRTATAGRCCGSHYISAVTDALISMNIPGLKVGDSTIQSLEADEIDKQDISYVGLQALVWKSMHEVCSLDLGRSRPQASVQDGLWAREWAERTGFRPQDFERKKNELESIPKHHYDLDDIDDGSTSQPGSIRIRDCPYGIFKMDYGIQKLKQRVRTYLETKPGDQWGTTGRGVWADCHALLRDDFTLLSKPNLERLATTIEYRMRMMNLATFYKTHLGVEFENCEEVDMYTRPDPRANDTDRERPIKIDVAIRVIRQMKLFDIPVPGRDGPRFDKVVLYLAQIAYEHRWDEREIEERFSLLQMARQADIDEKSLKKRRKP